MESIFQLDVINECTAFYTLDVEPNEQIVEQSESQNEIAKEEQKFGIEVFENPDVVPNEKNSNELEMGSKERSIVSKVDPSVDTFDTLLSSSFNDDFFSYRENSINMEMAMEEEGVSISKLIIPRKIKSLPRIKKAVNKLVAECGFNWAVISPKLEDYDKEKAFEVFNKLKAKDRESKVAYISTEESISEVEEKMCVNILAQQRDMLQRCLQELDVIKKQKQLSSN